MPGSLILLGGEPGIGKSTLMLQTVMRMPEKKTLYCSGDESERQIKLCALKEEHGHSRFPFLSYFAFHILYSRLKKERDQILVGVLYSNLL